MGRVEKNNLKTLRSVRFVKQLESLDQKSRKAEI